jgi:glycerol-3-phosphate dehydrogenase (NAD(P)+)
MKVAVLGSGGWGCALAKVLVDNNHDVTLWSKFENEIAKIKELGENPDKLPGIKLPTSISLTSDVELAIHDMNVLVIAVPSSFVRSTCELLKPYITEDQIIVSVAKGIEDGTLMSLEEVIHDVLPNNSVAVLSGPSHAEEVAKGIPTSVVVGSKDERIVKIIQTLFMNQNFRVYGTSDIIGVEMGGALKNVIALAAGISDGLGFGDNTKAALMTRGISEISRLGIAMGANQMTFNGLSGIGDLIVTCTSMHSRNRRAGILIGQGKTLQEALDEVKTVVEGVYSAKAALDLSKKYNVELPIIEKVNAVLFDGADPAQAVDDLMNRKKKFETLD